MDIQRKAFESSNNVNPDWSFKFDEELQQYVATDFEMTNQVDEFNEHWDTFRAGWEAKAQAVPEGFVVASTKDLNIIYDQINDWNTDWPLVFGLFNRILEAQDQAND